MKPLKVGTRKSPLAMKQTTLVIEELQKINPKQTFEIVGLSTKGDRQQHVSLSQIGGKGVFVKEVEYQLQQGAIDFAVHSLKDMPAQLPEDLVLAATPTRAMPYDCLIWREEKEPKEKNGLTIGTSSSRRELQLRALYSDMHFVPIRGKIETRLQKMHAQKMDGTVLACAGLARMDYFSKIPAYRILTPEECVPAVGQGILGVECRKNDRCLRDYLKQITEPKTELAAMAERHFLRQMQGNCEIPIGGFAQSTDSGWKFYGFLAENRKAKGRKICLTGSDPLSIATKAYQALK